MLFISPEFLLALPAVVVLYHLARSFARGAAKHVVLAASGGFIAYGGIYAMAVLAASVVVNYLIAWIAVRRGYRWLCWLAVILNLLYLSYFKYCAFFLKEMIGLTPTGTIVLPLGISFYTFHQIAFVVDWRRREPASFPSFAEYVTFVSFFPQLIAGPIVRSEQFFPQMKRLDSREIAPDWIVTGIAAFIIGMSKKVILADSAAAYSTPVFAAAAAGDAIRTLDAWIAAFAYTFQLYFDFSGYSDMAIGLALMLGIRLPFNFVAPYKARSIADFWRRWHITLSSFLRDYVYVALGGSRVGELRRWLNITLVMLLCGLWHGAGWTFVAWGGLHGAYLIAHRTWRLLVERHAPWLDAFGSYRAAAWTLTFLAVAVGWVLFRAQSFASAAIMLGAMAGGGGTATPLAGSYYDAAAVLAACAAISFMAPSLPEVLGTTAREEGDASRVGSRLVWRPTTARTLGLGTLAYLCIAFLREGYSEFLYFTF